MAQILIDTDILIAVLRGIEPLTRQLEERQRRADRLCFSPVTAAELWQGSRPAEEGLIQRLLNQMECLPIEEATGRLAGILLQRYRRSHAVSLPDAMIAATAVLHRCSLWTLNRRHYPMPELSLI